MFLPQMSPMWWIILMMMFIISFMISMSMMYFNEIKYFKINKETMKKNLNWEW